MQPDKIDKAYVEALANPLARFMGEPPHDALTVLAVAVRAALFEALEMIELGEIGLKRAAGGAYDSRADSLPFEMDCHGRIYAGTKVVRRVKEALDLFHPGPLSTPGERVLASRSRLGLNQPELAKLAHCTRSHLSHIERGSRPLTPQMAAGLARPLGVTAEYLLTGKDPGDDGR